MIHCYYGISTQALRRGCRLCCCFPGKPDSLSLCHMNLMSASCFRRYLRFCSSKQKHSPLCSRVRNNVCDEAAHNVPPPPCGECDPFLSIHNAGATRRRPPRLRGPAPPPSVRCKRTAERSENKRLRPSTETCGRGPGTDSCCVSC